jgi:hypothetical protein
MAEDRYSAANTQLENIKTIQLHMIYSPETDKQV